MVVFKGFQLSICFLAQNMPIPTDEAMNDVNKGKTMFLRSSKSPKFPSVNNEINKIKTYGKAAAIQRTIGTNRIFFAIPIGALMSSQTIGIALNDIAERNIPK